MEMMCTYCGEPIISDLYWEDDDGNYFCRERHLDIWQEGDRLPQTESPSDPAGSISIDDQIEAIQGNIQMLKNSGMVKGEWVDGDMQHEVVVLEAAIYTLRQISKRS